MVAGSLKLRRAQTALGARASETNRGKSAASLIRHGYDGRAVVRIILFNDGARLHLSPRAAPPSRSPPSSPAAYPLSAACASGPDKFRPDMFPDRFILVERQIMRSGQTQYKIMSVPKPGENATGTVVSTERSLVLRLADYFSIQVRWVVQAKPIARETLTAPSPGPQVHNPLVIMTQEDTKQMVTGSAEEKFKVRGWGACGAARREAHRHAAATPLWPLSCFLPLPSAPLTHSPCRPRYSAPPSSSPRPASLWKCRARTR